jgi:hypothetical protein
MDPPPEDPKLAGRILHTRRWPVKPVATHAQTPLEIVTDRNTRT